MRFAQVEWRTDGTVRFDGPRRGRFGTSDGSLAGEALGLPKSPSYWAADNTPNTVFPPEPDTDGDDYCRLFVHVDGFTLTLRSGRDYRYLLWVFGRKNMPNGYRLTGREMIGTTNRHWLSRLPARMKSWDFRRRVVAFLTGDNRQVRRFRDFHRVSPEVPA